ncbi:MAG: hypothetical protein AB8D52_02495 [Gammaproteobacteria bacterium]
MKLLKTMTVVGLAFVLSACSGESSDAKNKIEEAATKAKEAVAEKAGEAMTKAKDVVSEKAGEAMSKAKDVATDAKDSVSNKTEEMVGKVKEAASMASDTTIESPSWSGLDNMVVTMPESSSTVSSSISAAPMVENATGEGWRGLENQVTTF